MCENKECKCDNCTDNFPIDLSKDPFLAIIFMALCLGFMFPQEPIRTENEQIAFLKGKISAYEQMIKDGE